MKDIYPFGLVTQTFRDLPDGAPKVLFIEDVKNFVQKSGATPDAIVKALQEILRKLKIYEAHTQQRKLAVTTKLPETKQSLDMLAVLISKRAAQEDVEVEYCLSDEVYAASVIEKENEKVGLWLGANVMLEYTYEEAVEMLKKNMENGNTRLESLNEELAFIKEQMTLTEVTIARVYNYDVKVRRDEAGKAQANSKSKS